MYTLWKIFCVSCINRASLMVQMVKNLPAMQETRVRSLSWKDPLKKGMAAYSSILAVENPMDRGVWQAKVHGVTKSWTQIKQLSTHACHSLRTKIYVYITHLFVSFISQSQDIISISYHNLLLILPSCQVI